MALWIILGIAVVLLLLTARFWKSDKLSFALRLIIGGLVLYAEAPKLFDLDTYSIQALYSYHIFPMDVVRVMGTLGPYVGVLIGLGLVFGVLTRLSAAGWIIMCLMFIGMKLEVIFVQDRIASCGCFPGFLSNLKMNESIWIDIASIPLMLQVILANPERKFMSAWTLLPKKIRQSRLRLIW